MEDIICDGLVGQAAMLGVYNILITRKPIVVLREDVVLYSA